MGDAFLDGVGSEGKDEAATSDGSQLIAHGCPEKRSDHVSDGPTCIELTGVDGFDVVRSGGVDCRMQGKRSYN